MILQALYEYYQRKANDPDSKIEPQGLEWKEIPYVIVIDLQGHFIQLESTYEGEGKAKRAKRFLVVKTASRSGSKSCETANVFWDHYGYILAHPKRNSDEKNIEKERIQAVNQQSSFIKVVSDFVTKYPTNESFAAVSRFYELEENVENVLADPIWDECCKKNGVNMSFRVLGAKELVAEHIDLYTEIKIADQSLEKEGGQMCLVTGEVGPIAILHTPTPIIGGNSQAKLVGFQLKSGYDSYYKEQGLNAPISQKAEDAYTTALNTLLSKDSKNKYRIGETSVVFWSEKPTLIESAFPFIFEAAPKDDPDANAREIQSFYDSIHTGKLVTEGDTRFYVLGLTPNNARISVRFWKTGTVKEFSEKLAMHFDDLRINGSFKDSVYFSLFNLLSHISFQYKIANIPPNLISAMMQSILDGTTYPTPMQMHCLSRIKADRNVSYIRAAILKAYLNRKNRITNYFKERDIQMGLDLENTNQAYLCGRLFAVLERIQEIAQPKINSTIKDRYYGAASTTPVTVFSRLLALSNHHRDKLTPQSKVYYDKLIQEIVFGIDSKGMPAHLSLDDQSRFAIGYYHQRLALWESKNKEKSI